MFGVGIHARINRNHQVIKKLLSATAATSFALLATLPSCGKSANSGMEIENRGSDTLLEVAVAFSEIYVKEHPEIAISVSGGGSGTGISALIAGDLQIANSSRPFKDVEIADAKKHGVTPVEHIVGYDGIAIYVHKDNPIKSLTISQLNALFGDAGKIENWSDLGIDVADKSDDNIVLLSRQSSSGTYECFLETALHEAGRFKQRCNLMNSSKDVVKECANNISAIGYSGIAYASDAVRIVPIKKDEAAPAVLPTVDSVLDKSYPISRPLYMYTDGEPTGNIKGYIDWIKSDAGQKVLVAKRYVPLRKM
ncbi:MAG: phosphate transport system substrate-binding protein [Hyphomicrobiaceae bacterium]